MPATVVIGAQWGDEGKGKIVHLLTQQSDAVVRFNGGCNAGHTVYHKGKKFKLHHLPSGIFYPDKLNILGNGVVVDLGILQEEINYLKESNIEVKNLKISPLINIIMPYHRLFDKVYESESKATLGTTGRGVGPAYTDKVARKGIRIIDLFSPGTLKETLSIVLNEKNRILSEIYHLPGKTLELIYEELLSYRELVLPFVEDTVELIWELLGAGKRLLFEGAQGTFLDIDFGTYPYVTSSHTTVGGACIGAGIPPSKIDKIIGVVKAYTTRVGEGPFPTELKGKEEEKLRELGGEFGTTTGRPRRCGWLDIVMLKLACKINEFTELALTKLDVLSSFSLIKVATTYICEEKLLEKWPYDLKTQKTIKPVYREFEGWEKDISDVENFSKLPKQAQEFIFFLEEELQTKITIISVGPQREQTIIR